MIAVDTSSFVAFLSGASGKDVDAVDLALSHHQAALPPVVVSELLSDPKLPALVKDTLKPIPRLEILEGYWERAGFLRASVLARGHRAPLADTLIAQSCLDHD